MKNNYSNFCFKFTVCLLLAYCGLCIACNSNSKPPVVYKTMVYTTDLVNEPALIKVYDSMHSKKGIWPELKKANLASGIHEIKIYRFDNRLFMMVTVPADADPSRMDSLYLGADKKIEVWNKMMSNFQRALPGVDTTKKWSSLELIHHYADGEYQQ
ncbi:MAG: L-rhamnose mutarotase [bacterium]